MCFVWTCSSIFGHHTLSRFIRENVCSGIGLFSADYLPRRVYSLYFNKTQPGLLDRLFAYVEGVPFMNLCSFFQGYSAHGNWIFDNSGISSQYIQIQG